MSDTTLRPASAGARQGVNVRWIAGGIAFILATVQYFLTQIVIASAWMHPAYSWDRNYISDLGNTACGPFTIHGFTEIVCSPLHAAMNASFIATGLLTIIGAMLLWSFWPATRLARTGLILLVIAGVGKTFVGIVPENTNLTLHTLSAFNLPVTSIAILLLGLSVRHTHRAVLWLSVLTAVVGLLAGAVFTAAQYAGHSPIPGAGIGTLERIAGYPSNIWVLGIGILALTRVRLGRLTATRQTNKSSDVTVH